jgi:hypothetical protein
VARDHHSVSDRTVRFDDTSVTTSGDKAGYCVIGLQAACESFSDAGGLDGQSIAH